MSRRLFGGVFLAATLLVCAVGVIAGAPGFWQAATQADFLRGEVDQLSIDEHGRLTLGPELQRVHDGGVPFIWTLLPAPDGSIFLGTGNDGKVIRVDRAGNGTVFYDSSELEVHALANAPNGQLYVGTSPDGRIYRIDAQGRAETFFDPEDKYIWSLAVDRQGAVFAATGDKGIVYRITPDGKSTKFFATKATHAVALAFDASGQLLVGTGSPGRVFRVDTAGKGFLLLDTAYQEIHSIRVDAKGVIFAAAQSGRQAQQSDTPAEITVPTPPAPAIPNVSTEITSIAVIDVPVTASSSQSGAPARDDRRPTGAVYRVQPDGLWDELWTSREDAPYDLSLDADGSVLIATGPKGKLFRLSGNPMRALLLTRVPSQQATMLARVAERTFVATANPGLLMSMSSTRALRGTYESEVKDAQTVATLGRAGLAREHSDGRASAAVHAIRKHQDARRGVERLGRTIPERQRLGRHEPEGSLSPVARDSLRQVGDAGSDVGHLGVLAAERASAGHVDHGASPRCGVSEAVLEWRNRNRRSG